MQRVAESIGNYIDVQASKGRRIAITVVGTESYILWNGLQVHHAQSIGEAILGRRFGGRTNWRFFTKENIFESVVMKT